MNQTEQFQLNQWEKSDRIMMEDFNADNLKTEQALAEHAELLRNCGNCRITTTTYKGNGSYDSSHPNSLTFDAPPVLVMVSRSGSHEMFMVSGNDSAKADDNSWVEVTWSGNTVQWYSTANASTQYNVSGVTYRVVAFLAAK